MYSFLSILIGFSIPIRMSETQRIRVRNGDVVRASTGRYAGRILH